VTRRLILDDDLEAGTKAFLDLLSSKTGLPVLSKKGGPP